jgi:hypothetical protein
MGKRPLILQRHRRTARGTRVYSAHNRSHVNGSARYGFGQSYMVPGNV